MPRVKNKPKYNKGETKMKKRRIVTVSFLLIAVLMMGIAFAALTDNLFIKGEAYLKTDIAQPAFDAKVHFVQESADGALKTERVSGTGTSSVSGVEEKAEVGTTDNDSATFHVYSLGQKDEYVIFSFVIANESDQYDAYITLDANSATANSDLLKVEYSIDNATWNATTDVSAYETICPKATDAGFGYKTVYVKVTLIKAPTDSFTAAISVDLTASTESIN